MKPLWERMERAVNMFTETPDASAREAVHVVLVGQMVRGDDFDPNPDIEPNTRANDFCTVEFATLVRMKLNSFRRQDQVHIGDMMLQRRRELLSSKH